MLRKSGDLAAEAEDLLGPTIHELRPYWTMRRLDQTIREGGYLTPKLYVPKAVWLTVREDVREDGSPMEEPLGKRSNSDSSSPVRIPAVEAKITACGKVRTCLESMAGVDPDDVGSALRELEALEEIMISLHSSLSRKLGVGSTWSSKGSGSGASGSGSTSEDWSGQDDSTPSKSTTGGKVRNVIGLGRDFSKSMGRMRGVGKSSSGSGSSSDGTEYLSSLQRLFSAGQILGK